jgi:hypothetical protein
LPSQALRPGGCGGAPGIGYQRGIGIELIDRSGI